MRLWDVKKVTQTEFQQEFSWDMDLVSPAYSKDLKAVWPVEDFIDLGGGTKTLSYITVYRAGKEKVLELLGDAKGYAVWDDVCAAIKEESPFLQ